MERHIHAHTSENSWSISLFLKLGVPCGSVPTQNKKVKNRPHIKLHSSSKPAHEQDFLLSENEQIRSSKSFHIGPHQVFHKSQHHLYSSPIHLCILYLLHSKYPHYHSPNWLPQCHFLLWPAIPLRLDFHWNVGLFSKTTSEAYFNQLKISCFANNRGIVVLLQQIISVILIVVAFMATHRFSIGKLIIAGVIVCVCVCRRV